MKKYALVAFGLLAACGRPAVATDHIKSNIYRDAPIEPVFIHADFVAYYASFEEKLGISPDSVSIDYVVQEDPVVGLCYGYTDRVNNIEIDPNFWNKASENERENLIFHELGHCLLLLEHDDKMMDNNGISVPESIMYPAIFGGEEYYEGLKSHYYEQLMNAQ